MLTGMRIFSGLTLLLLCASVHSEEVSPFEDAPTMTLVQEGSEPVAHKATGATASKALPKAVHAGAHKAADNTLYEMQSQLFSQNLDEDLREFNILPKGKSLYQKQTELYNKMLTNEDHSEVTVLMQKPKGPIDSAFGDVLTGESVMDAARCSELGGDCPPDIAFNTVLVQTATQPQGDPAIPDGEEDPASETETHPACEGEPGCACDPAFPDSAACQALNSGTSLAQKGLAPRGFHQNLSVKGDRKVYGAPDLATEKGRAEVLRTPEENKKIAEKKKKEEEKEKEEEEEKDKNTVATAVSQHITKKAAEVDFVETNMFNF